ncbi:hypothetical protein SYNPS1DRAFT_29316 [Syncephalis pseudoplumigaleata]|uniref:O-acyltransferase WSD1 C-terminal domain-containing protein n=1 Tax=Syncephalis pseudoplumigaleata TaxID=1712513 RepID=A0A4P9Z0Q4_9FUNG|nr:hypothetical protein SYNPS1DRAFT_29316 [Syncephalis pseudoplumigaleata]|eukprot:RKP24940.1 hypothetical protein SYNPS1DRAFT_29316 [Syncephalis pseudoplumigaleata]
MAQPMDIYASATGNKYTSITSYLTSDNSSQPEGKHVPAHRPKQHPSVPAPSISDPYLTYIDSLLLRLGASGEHNFAVSSIVWMEGDMQPGTMLALLERLCQQTPKFQQRCVPGSFWQRARWEAMDSALQANHTMLHCSVNRGFDSRHGILSNIPGPDMPLCIDVEQTRHSILSYALYPPSVSSGCVSMGIASYNGSVVVSVVADDSPVYPEKARRLADGIYAAFEQLLAEVHATSASSS